MLFSHNVIDCIEEDECVLVMVVDPHGKETKYRCQYLVGTNGGRFVGLKLGVQMDGPTGITDMVSIHLRADLSLY